MSKNIKKIVIGSRASALAKKQVQIFKENIFSQISKINFEEKFVKTSADKSIDKKLSDLGNKGLFTKEIDQEQLLNKIDISVHSLKDLSYNLCSGLEIVGFIKREDCRDAIYYPGKKSLVNMKRNALIGTSSVRREIQLKKIRPDLKFKFIRGNIETRIKKVLEGQYDGTILAMAGIKRLGIKNNYFPLEIEQMVPAIGQGIIAIVCREKDQRNTNIVKFVSDQPTKLSAECERSFLRALEGNCNTPIGANATIIKEDVIFNYFISCKKGKFFKKEKKTFSMKEAKQKCFELGLNLKQNYSFYD